MARTAKAKQGTLNIDELRKKINKKAGINGK
jgi:hypothetical protein